MKIGELVKKTIVQPVKSFRLKREIYLYSIKFCCSNKPLTPWDSIQKKYQSQAIENGNGLKFPIGLHKILMLEPTYGD